MALGNRARTNDGYSYLINQVANKTFDHINAIEYDKVLMGDASNIVDPIEQGLEP